MVKLIEKLRQTREMSSRERPRNSKSFSLKPHSSHTTSPQPKRKAGLRSELEAAGQEKTAREETVAQSTATLRGSAPRWNNFGGRRGKRLE